MLNAFALLPLFAALARCIALPISDTNPTSNSSLSKTADCTIGVIPDRADEDIDVYWYPHEGVDLHVSFCPTCHPIPSLPYWTPPPHPAPSPFPPFPFLSLSISSPRFYTFGSGDFNKNTRCLQISGYYIAFTTRLCVSIFTDDDVILGQIVNQPLNPLHPVTYVNVHGVGAPSVDGGGGGGGGGNNPGGDGGGDGTYNGRVTFTYVPVMPQEQQQGGGAFALGMNLRGRFGRGWKDLNVVYRQRGWVGSSLSRNGTLETGRKVGGGNNGTEDVVEVVAS